MPLYEYECKKCGHRFERIQSYSERPVRRCPKCKKGRVEKLLSAPAVQFKGTGWYVTDYGRKGSAALPEHEKKEGDKAKDAGAGKDSGKDSKSDSAKSDSGKEAAKAAGGRKGSRKD